MTIKQLREKLEALETMGMGDANIEIENSYWRNEGYGDNADDFATSPIESIVWRDGVMALEST